MARRSYGTGQLFVRADSNGRETWYGSWRVGGRRVKRRIGARRRGSTAEVWHGRRRKPRCAV